MAIRTLRGICAAKDAPPAARVAAAVALLDRGWGKPAQSHTGEDGEGEIRVTIRHLVEGMPDEYKIIEGVAVKIDATPVKVAADEPKLANRRRV